MDKKTIHILQADTIFKALHYVCKREEVEMSDELEEVFTVLSEMNPNDTQASDCLDIMESLKDFIKSHETYAEFFEEEDEDEDEEDEEDQTLHSIE